MQPSRLRTRYFRILFFFGGVTIRFILWELILRRLGLRNWVRKTRPRRLRADAIRFRALAINSGSYATCTNVLCSIPPLPADHPPTLFLHGQNDIAVPVGTMQMYEQALRDMGVETRVIIDPLIVHQWLKVAPEEIPAWFAAH